MPLEVCNCEKPKFGRNGLCRKCGKETGWKPAGEREPEYTEEWTKIQTCPSCGHPMAIWTKGRWPFKRYVRVCDNHDCSQYGEE